MAKMSLTLEELRTIFSEIENLLNSRPLQYVDEDPNNNSLTLNHPLHRGNVNAKCFDINKSLNVKRDDVKKSF